MKKLFKITFMMLLVFGALSTLSCKKKEPKPEPKPELVVYTITWMDEAGNKLAEQKVNEGVVPSYTYNLGDKAEDYKFLGWSKSLKGEILSSIPAASSNATYYAVLEQIDKSHTVKFVDFDGTVLSEQTIDYKGAAVAPKDPERTGYTFKGWDTEFDEVTENLTITAVYEINKYTVKFVDFDDRVISTVTVEYNKGANAPENPERKGYTFAHWDVDFSKVTGDLTVKAVYDINQYTITFNSNGGSDVEAITKDYGTSIDGKKIKPTKDGFKFVCWTYDELGTKKVEWPIVLEEDLTLYATWNEAVDIKGYLKSMITGASISPMSYIPEHMRYDDTTKLVEEKDITYNYDVDNKVSSFKYGGFGAQWHMVIDNIHQSQNFYNVLTICEDVINASVVAFNNYLDKNPSDEAEHKLDETTYTAFLTFKKGILIYTLQYKTNLNIPLIGEVAPTIEMIYDVTSGERVVRISLNDKNAIKYAITESKYIFGIEYGIKGVERKAYCDMIKDENGDVTGHIYEFVTALDKATISSCADFYIGDEYTTAVGNKANGLPGFKGYINELYETQKGRLLGYEVREELTVLGITGQYNTLWFNLDDIKGINSVRMPKAEKAGHNPNDVYVNGSASVFKPAFNKKLTVNTSRKFDIELRNQYFYTYDATEQKFISHEVKTPMMFIQQGANFDTFKADIKATNGIDAQVLLAQKHLDKIISDYETLIDVFIEHKDNVTAQTITEWINK